MEYGGLWPFQQISWGGNGVKNKLSDVASSTLVVRHAASGAEDVSGVAERTYAKVAHAPSAPYVCHGGYRACRLCKCLASLWQACGGDMQRDVECRIQCRSVQRIIRSLSLYEGTTFYHHRM
jgi:hypothetical protein